MRKHSKIEAYYDFEVEEEPKTYIKYNFKMEALLIEVDIFEPNVRQH